MPLEVVYERPAEFDGRNDDHVAGPGILVNQRDSGPHVLLGIGRLEVVVVQRKSDKHSRRCWDHKSQTNPSTYLQPEREYNPVGDYRHHQIPGVQREPGEKRYRGNEHQRHRKMAENEPEAEAIRPVRMNQAERCQRAEDQARQDDCRNVTLDRTPGRQVMQRRHRGPKRVPYVESVQPVS